MKAGQIHSHFPLHKRNTVDSNIKLFIDKYIGLKYGFLNGKFMEKMMALNTIKSYYGEKYAFEVAFLIH